MEQKDIDLLSIHDFYYLKSDKTGECYIDDKNSCFLFDLKSDAERVVRKRDLKDVTVEKPRKFKQAEFTSGFYGMGIRHIILKEKNKDARAIEIEEKNTQRRYYNSGAVYALLRLQETAQKRYLVALSKEELLAPIILGERKEKEYPDIHYCFGLTKDKKKLYVLFTRLQEFDEWNEKKQKSKWKPISTGLAKFKQIRKDSDIIINPLTNKIVLTNSQLTEMLGKG